MSKAALLELADRVEKASGADRELDAKIWQVISPDKWLRECSFVGNLYAGHRHSKVEKHNHELRMGAHYAPHYTSSLDAAMTLVPEGFFVEVEQRATTWRCGLFNPATGLDGEAIAATETLARTAAALRARAQQESKDA